MIPAFHLLAILDLLTAIDSDPRPADAVTATWLRARRALNEDDRASILGALQVLLRHQARLGWRLAHHGHADTPRNRFLVWLALAEGARPAQIERLFSGEADALNDDDYALLVTLAGGTIDHPAMPEAVRLECPPWAEEALRKRFGDSFEAEMSSLQASAPVDLRVNPLQTTREAVLLTLRAQGLDAAPSRLSPNGIRVAERFSLTRLDALRTGAVEIQDEGSQLIALLLDARPGDRVVDFCAGAGGKTLAIAADMANKGRITACDVSEGRLKRCAERLKKAGFHNGETRLLATEKDRWVKRHKASYDRVLVDAPCSGTGTWRRNPDARWRSPHEKGLDSLVALQASILASAARLVKPGGRLVYATCSVLAQENEAQVKAFLAAHPDFKLVPLSEAAPTLVLPQTDGCMALTPARHDTDGFFAAVMTRQSTPVATDPPPA